MTMNRHEPDWYAGDTYWANRGGYYSGLEGRAKSTNPHDYGSPARYVFDLAWERGNARREDEAKAVDEAMPALGPKQLAKLFVGISAAVATYLGFLYIVFEVLT